jgi:hypothetical protein
LSLQNSLNFNRKLFLHGAVQNAKYSPKKNKRVFFQEEERKNHTNTIYVLFFLIYGRRKLSQLGNFRHLARTNEGKTNLQH